MCIPKRWKWNAANRKLQREFLDEHKTVEQAKIEIAKDFTVEKVLDLLFDFHVMDLLNWGTCRPDNDNAFTINNIEYLYDTIAIYTKKEIATGKGYGTFKNPPKDITRNFTSGMIRSKKHYKIEEGMRIMAEIKMPVNSTGAFSAFWLFGDKKSNCEVDIFERMAKVIADDTLTFTTHIGEQGMDRKMYGRKQKTRVQGMWKLYDVLFEDGWVIISINNTLIFKTQWGYPVGKKMEIIFNDAVRFWKDDNEFMEEVENCLPRTMAIRDVTILQRK